MASSCRSKSQLCRVLDACAIVQLMSSRGKCVVGVFVEKKGGERCAGSIKRKTPMANTITQQLFGLFGLF